MTIARTRRYRWRSLIVAGALLLSAFPAAAVTGNVTSYPQDTGLQVGTLPLLIIKAGSVSSGLTVNATSFTVSVADTGGFTVQYPGPDPGNLANDGGLSSCRYANGNNEITVNGPGSGLTTVVFTPTATPICRAPSSNAGGGGGISQSISLLAPTGGQTLTIGSTYQVVWTTTGSGITGIRISLSTDSGATFPTVIEPNVYNSSAYNWSLVSRPSSSTARLKVESLSSNGSVLATAVSSSDFVIKSSSIPDNVPPGNARDATVEAGDGQVQITWTNPTDEDFTGVKVVRRTDTNPTSPTDGTVVYDGDAGYLLDTSLTNGVTYRYSLFAHDGVPNFASGVQISATPVAGSLPPSPPNGLTPEEAAAPRTDSTASQHFSADLAQENTPTIDVDKGLLVPPQNPTLCNAGDLIKGSQRAVYYCGRDGKRYVFPNVQVYMSWYPDFSQVKTISDAILAAIPIGGTITYKPGARMVKIVSDPKAYAVARNGILRWVSSEAVARALYGDHWNQLIDDVPDAFFFSYTIGKPLDECTSSQPVTCYAAGEAP